MDSFFFLVEGGYEGGVSLRIVHGMLSGMVAVLRQQSWISK